MDKYPLIGVSICAVILLILASLSNVVGYQTVQSSNQKAINSEVNSKELLFQTIVDIINNKDIQRIILKHQINREGFFNPEPRYSIFNTPMLTKNQLKHMYLVGLMFSKTISKSRIHSMLERYRSSNQGLQKEITAVIEKEATLNGELTQLSTSKCDCGNNSEITSWPFPVICTILTIMLFFTMLIAWWLHIGNDLLIILGTLFGLFNC